MKQLISSFIFNKLDYCNALLISLLFSTIAPVQWVQNAAARLLLGLSRRDHVRPAVKELHWLPVVHRIQFKLALRLSWHWRLFVLVSSFYIFCFWLRVTAFQSTLNSSIVSHFFKIHLPANRTRHRHAIARGLKKEHNCLQINVINPSRLTGG